MTQIIPDTDILEFLDFDPVHTCECQRSDSTVCGAKADWVIKYKRGCGCIGVAYACNHCLEKILADHVVRTFRCHDCHQSFNMSTGDDYIIYREKL